LRLCRGRSIDAPRTRSIVDNLAHPIPYQGSKRLLADAILGTVAQRRFRRLYEPFAGSAAITLAAASRNLADAYVISDLLEPLTHVWREILTAPDELTARYAAIWRTQLTGDDNYNAVRAAFNRCGGAAELLYLFARCVKNAPRFNRNGVFNQSADLRRKGMNPVKMGSQIAGAHRLLTGRTEVLCGDFNEVLTHAGPRDLVYMDPPYEGTSTGMDRRYYRQLERDRLIRTLFALNERDVPYVLSYDGRHGEKTYGEPLPQALRLRHIELRAGRSSQATLIGRRIITVESLYLSPNLSGAHQGSASAL
jgi:DNA adenine methylase